MSVFNNGELNLDYIRGLTRSKYSDVQASNRIRGVILDGELPLPKVIGFSFAHGGTETDETLMFPVRNKSMRDSTLEIINNLAKVIFIPYKYESANVVPNILQAKPEPTRGLEEVKSTYSRRGVFMKGPHEIETIDENLYLFTNLTEVRLTLVVTPLTGNTTLADSMGLIDSIVRGDQNTSYVGVPSRSSLEDYIRFIPKEDGTFTYKLLNGVTDEQLNLLIETYGRDVVW